MLLVLFGGIFIVLGLLVRCKSTKIYGIVAAYICATLAGVLIPFGIAGPFSGMYVYNETEKIVALSEMKVLESGENIYLCISETKSIKNDEIIEILYTAKSENEENIQLLEDVKYVEGEQYSFAQVVITKKEYKGTIWSFALSKLKTEYEYTFYIPEGGVEKTVYLK